MYCDFLKRGQPPSHKFSQLGGGFNKEESTFP